MTSTLVATRTVTAEPRVWRPGAPLLFLSMLGAGAFMIAAGLALRGSTWILPDGLLGGGVAMLVMAPFARGALDVIVTLCPFMFYTASPVGGILTVGSSDILLPVVLAGMIIAWAVAERAGGNTETEPRLHIALPLGLISGLLLLGSITGWNLASPDYLLKRSIADAIKLLIGVTYFVVVYLLGRRLGMEGILRSFRIWTWTATALSLGSLAGITGAVTIIPSDGYRSNGYFQDPNLYAGFLLLSLSIVLFLATLGEVTWLPLQSLAIVGGLVTTGSRAGMASLALLLVLALVIINSARLRATILGLVGVSMLLFGWLLLRGDGRTSVLGLDRLVSASADVDDDPRLRLWGLAIEKWLDQPVWGIGLGQFERFSSQVEGRLKSTGLGYVTHNTFLFFLVAFGVLGLGLFLFLLFWLTVRLYASNLPRPACHALFSGLVVLCSQFMTLNLQNLRYVWIYFGLMLALSMLAHDGEDERVAQ